MSGDARHHRIARALGPALALVASLAPAAPALGDPPQPNSPAVAEVSWFPAQFTPLYDLIVKVALHPGPEPHSIALRYCRIQHYECAAPLAVTGSPENDYAAVIRWDPNFFTQGVREVGLNLTLEARDGRVETSPTMHWPKAPQDLAADAPNFYYVGVESKSSPSASSPAGGVASTFAALVLAAIGWRATARR